MIERSKEPAVRPVVRRRVDIKSILANHEKHLELIQGVRRFCCALEGMLHDKDCVCNQNNDREEKQCKK